MNTLFNAILLFFGFSIDIISERARALRNSLLVLIGTFYFLCFAQLIIGKWCHPLVQIISLGCFIAATFHYFRIGNIIREGLIGEFLELTRITPNVPGAIQTQLGNALFSFRENMFFFTATACMIVPYLPIWNYPLIFIAFTIAATAIVVLLWRMKTIWLRRVTWITVTVYLTISLAMIFPQTRFYWHETAGKALNKIIPGDAAKTATKIKSLRQKQRADALSKAYQDALDWQKENPGHNLPKEIEDSIKAAKKGITVEELQAHKEKEVAGRKEIKPKRAKPVETLAVNSNKYFTQLTNQLSEGRYRLSAVPESASAQLRVRIRCDSSREIKEDRSLNENQILIKKGEEGTSIGTKVPALVRIYKI